MIKIFLNIFFILFYFNNWAQQNLVPNYSFENYTLCPSIGPGEINKATPWFQPNFASASPGGSSDFYHSCSGYVPYNVTFQFPRTGNAYAGINLFHDTTGSWKDWDREYIEVELISELVQNKKYCLSYYTNKANRSGFAIKQLQAVLTTDSLLSYDSNWGYIAGTTPILGSSFYVSDTLEWTRISQEITANGGEKFLTIGNFEPGINVDYQMGWWPYSAPDNTLGYYLFDDVSVYELPDYNAGNDTTICPWDTMVIGPQAIRSDVQYSWSPTAGLSNPNIANPLASPLVNTSYILTVTDTCQWACNSILTDTITISVQGCLGVEKFDISNLKFDIYPNPAGEIVFIERNDKTSLREGMVEMYNINGKILCNFNLKEGVNRVEIDLTPYQNGVYIFKVMVDGETTEVKRLVITK